MWPSRGNRRLFPGYWERPVVVLLCGMPKHLRAYILITGYWLLMGILMIQKQLIILMRITD